jgi:hypothetical protein
MDKKENLPFHEQSVYVDPNSLIDSARSLYFHGIPMLSPLKGLPTLNPPNYPISLPLPQGIPSLGPQTLCNLNTYSNMINPGMVPSIKNLANYKVNLTEEEIDILREGIRRYLQDTSQESVVIIQYSCVAQKSYGHEKRYV